MIRLREFLHKRARKLHKLIFTSDVKEINDFKKLVSDTPCVGCTQKSLQLDGFMKGATGWEAQISCKNCNFKATMNSTGFDAKQITSKGKAVS